MGRYSAIWALSADDVITFTTASSVYSSTDGLVNVQGFVYSPLGGATAAVAWGLALTRKLGYSAMCLDGYGWRGPFSVVPYNHVTVNWQGVWNNSTSKVIIPVAGIYFVDLCLWRN